MNVGVNKNMRNREMQICRAMKYKHYEKYLAAAQFPADISAS
jgi:hypothetical protein